MAVRMTPRVGGAAFEPAQLGGRAVWVSANAVAILTLGAPALWRNGRGWRNRCPVCVPSTDRCRPSLLGKCLAGARDNGWQGRWGRAGVAAPVTATGVSGG